jgi:deoxycytidine triphosphate deaminase
MYLNAANIESILVFNDQFKHFGKAAQVGYDLTLHQVKQICSGNHKLTQSGSDIDQSAYIPVPLMINPHNEKEKLWALAPGVYSITFHQGCSLPNNIKAEIVHRSSLLRMGVEIKSAVYDPGFKTEFMGAVMVVHNTVTIEYGSRVAQILMAETQLSEEYAGQFQGEKDIK